MWRIALIVVGVLALAAVPARPQPAPVVAPPAEAPVGTPGPGWAVDLADKFEQRQVADGQATTDDVAYWRYISWHGMWVPLEDQHANRVVGSYYLNGTHFASTAVRWRVVPGSGGLLWWFDLRETGWTVRAWRAVARRDQVMTDLAVAGQGYDPRVCESLRRRSGVKQDPKTLSVEKVVWGPGLLRDALEPLRNATYYDLLYSSIRFPDDGKVIVPGVTRPPLPDAQPAQPEWRIEKKTVHHPGGKYAYPDDTGRVVENVAAGNYVVELRFKVLPVAQVVQVQEDKFGPADTKPDKDFPATDEDFESIFKVVPRIKATAFGMAVSSTRGGIVVGGTEPDIGTGRSAIANNERWGEEGVGTYGWYAKTYDRANNSKDPGFVEQAAKFAGTYQQPLAQAHESLATTPAGFIAMQLSDGAGKRQDKTDTEVTRPGPKPRRDAHSFLHYGAVRTGGDCLRCHLPFDGVIPLADLVNPLYLGERPPLTLKFDNPADDQRFRGFFEGVSELEGGFRARHKAALTRVTGWYGKPWTGAEMAQGIEDFLGYYDWGVAPGTVAAELGVTEADVVAAARDSPDADPRRLTVKFPIPRRAWDREARQQMIRLVLAQQQRKQGIVHQFGGVKP